MHTITLGAYNNSSDDQNETSTVWFDDIEIAFSSEVAGVLANDTDADGDPLTTTLVSGSGPQNGTLSLNADGTFVYAPNANFHGTDSFQYVANDGTTNSSPATVTLYVQSVNDPPVATAKSYNLVEDGSLSASDFEGLLLGASDIDNPIGDLTAVLVLAPANGAATVNLDGSFIYTPNLDFSGLDTFRFAVRDGQNTSNDATVSVQVSAVNDAPRPAADNYSVVENTTLVADRLAASESEILFPRGSVWRYLDNGTDEGSAWRTAGYDDSAWVREDNPFNLGAEYGYGDAGQENRPERTVVGFGPNPQQKYITTYFRRFFQLEDASAVTALTVWLLRDDGAAVYLNGQEILRNNLPAGASYTTPAGPQTVSLNDEFTYFQFSVPHDALVSGENLLAVEIHQNDPTSSDISFDLELEATVIDNATAPIVNDYDPENDPMTAVLVQGASHGTLVLDPNGTFTYTPNENFEGVDTFTYAATDGQAQSDPVTVTITVTPGPNDIPVAAPDAYTIDEDTVLVVPSLDTGVLNNDTDGDFEPLTASVLDPPANGTVALNPDGTFTYTPNADYFGVDLFTYRAWDGSDDSQPGTVTITVNPLPDAPFAADDRYFIAPGGSLVVPPAMGVSANDYDPDGQAITASLESQPPAGQGFVLLASEGAFGYNAEGFHGTTSFTYRVSDGGSFSNVAVVMLVVDAAPVATGGSYEVHEDTTLVVGAAEGVLSGDADAENDPLTAVVATPPAHGTLSIAPNGSFTYTPAANYFGPDSFTYSTNDGDQSSTPATITITVLAVNDSPVGTADAFDVLFNDRLVVDAAYGVLANDADIDSAALTAALAPDGGPLFGVLTFSADGSFVYMPNADYIGPDRFTYFVSDGSLQSMPTTVTLNVTSAANLIAINEIMYHPSSENDAEEYVELINVGIGTLSLAGWRFDRGIDFTFPNVAIEGGGILVVAADLGAFSAKYPGVANVIGGWTGSLSNGGERVRLVDPFGQQIDQVDYADEGDWAVRRLLPDPRGTNTFGWAWIAEHDGGGRSLELVNPLLSNQRGQNWAASTAVHGTPGGANSMASSATAPVIWDVEHSPAVPRSTDSVTVTAKLADVPDAAIVAAVRYRPSTATPGPFQSVTMFDDGMHGDSEAGDGIYGAILPPQANLAVVEFYVHATNDAGLARTWPGPTDASSSQGANLLYQVDETAYAGDQPVYRLIMTSVESNTFRNINRQSNAQMNATLVNVDGTGTDIVYNVGVRVRGSGSRFTFVTAVPNLRINIPSDRVWQGVTSINLNTQHTNAQLVGMSLFELAGLASEEGVVVQVRLNGENRAVEARQHGSYVRLEAAGADWAENHYPKDPNGNFYRGTSNLIYNTENPALYVNDFDKQTNTGENDYSDVIALTRALDPAQTPDGVFVATVRQVIDVDQWMRFFAVNTLLVNEENGLVNGNEDDYSLYRGAVDPRFDLVPHDLDTVLGQGDTPGDPNRHVLNELRTNPRLARLFDRPEFLNLYYFHLIELADTVFAPDVIEPLLDNLLASWVAPANIQAMKTFARNRVTSVRAQVAQAPPYWTPPVATIDGVPPEITPLATALLTVGGQSVTRYQFRLNDGPWSEIKEVGTPINLGDLANGTYSVAVAGINAAGQVQDLTSPTISRTWTVNTGFSPLRISEVLADNRSIGHEGALPDAIELYNAGATEFDLSGVSISDRLDEPAKFIFPSGRTIAAGGYLVLYADSATTSGMHLGFSLERSGEGVYVFDSAASGGALLDQVEFGAQLPDMSIARDEQFQWRLSTPTLGAANDSIVVLGNSNRLKINEWLADGRRLFEADLIELYNPEADPIALGGMYLTDNPNGYPDKHEIAPNSFIGAQDYAVFVADEQTGAGAEHVDFQLSANRESIALLDQHLRRIDTVIFPPQKSDVSQGGTTDGASRFASFSPPTFGLSNAESSSLPDPLALLDHLRITELMYHPQSDGELEFLELHNTSATTLNLEGVRLRNGVNFVFPAMSLGPNAFTVLVANDLKFAVRYPGVSIAGQFVGRLDNGGENVELALPIPFDGNIQDFTYDDSWYPKSDGGGPSLVAVNPLADNGAWNSSSGWRASYSTGGSPGRADLLYADQDGDGVVGLWDLVQLRNKFESGDLSGDLNNDGIVDRSDLASFVSSYGTITASAVTSPAAASAVVVRAGRARLLSAEPSRRDAIDVPVQRGRGPILLAVRESVSRHHNRRYSACDIQQAIDDVMTHNDTLGVTVAKKVRAVRRHF
jgi:VCBS repeat-containing protein